MLCPACNSQDFESVALEAGLAAQCCTSCSGVWIDLDGYRAWRRHDAAAAIDQPMHVAEIEEEAGAARFCPKTGRLMARVKVSNEAPFRLDYSASAQGVWLDRGEWEILNGLGLARQLDAVVSERWQRQLQSTASRERMDRAQRARFGEAAYQELTRMRDWLQAQPNSAEMMAFLNAKAD